MADSAASLARWPALERAAEQAGLEPTDFVFSKDRPAPLTMPFIGPFFYDYTVFVGGEHFTVTEPNDARFLEFIHARIAATSVQAATTKAHGVLARLTSWMNRPI